MKVLKILLLLLSIVILTGCANTKKEQNIGYNKSPQEWYDAIYKSIYSKNLESADKQFISFRSEHIDSKLLPTTMLMLALAHMDNEEYLLANFYLDEYLRIYPDGANGNYALFLKIKAEFLSIKDIDKEQKQVIKALSDAKNFYASYKNTTYAPLIQTIIARLEMSQYLLNEEVASLYDRVGKPKAAKIYRDKNKIYPFKASDIKTSGGFLSNINLSDFHLGL